MDFQSIGKFKTLNKNYPSKDFTCKGTEYSVSSNLPGKLVLIGNPYIHRSRVKYQCLSLHLCLTYRTHDFRVSVLTRGLYTNTKTLITKHLRDDS